jgi:seryl-tRNA synthetase
MLEAKRIREDIDVSEGLLNRQCSLDGLNAFKKSDKEWREALTEIDALKEQRNKQVPKGKPTPEQLKLLKELSSSIKEKQEAVSTLEENTKQKALYLPNIPQSSVPIGKSEDENVVCYSVGEPKTTSFIAKPHDEVGQSLGILDFDSAAKISGSRFVVYRGLGAKLERALLNFMLDVHTSENGYEEVYPPVIVNQHSMKGTGQLPKFSDDSFSVSETAYLSPTAEVQLTNLYRDSIVSESDLPIKVTAGTSCFRKEAGSYGKDMKGLIRHHQFNKVELVQLVKPESSNDVLKGLLSHAELILQKLELPYRVVELCTGDLGFSSSKTFDIDVWLPAQKTYREISSCSNFLDFQSRRAMIRYRSESSGNVEYLHTINGSGLAVGRTMAAILENYQEEDGSITIPKSLQSYMGVTKINA